ncbi:MAG: molybdopterin molybdotransferase MoeA [Kyrpidia tusciae]|nr:gephyrin-like molybdotransferase Glp [Kyrpidia tusciae]MBE3551986.1 molybdopterin molybdotransferase MoeA [Kyrpidia tusciae]
MPKLEPIDFADARRLCFARVTPLDRVRIPLGQSAGEVLARPVELPEDVPPFDRSVMDGFAVRSADCAQAKANEPAVLSVVEEVAAGGWPSRSLGPGQAVRTMTGAPVAPGADAVIPIEDVRFPEGSRGLVGERIEVSAPVPVGESIQRRGEDLARGSAPVEAGCRIGPAEAAVLATAGVEEVEVRRAPRVALFSTGDELVSGPGPLTPGKIRNSNGPMLLAMMRLAGADARDLGRLPDRPEKVIAAVAGVLEWADVVVTTGAVSVGDYDVVPGAMEELGMDILFQRVRIRPGKPVTVAVKGNKMWFALPGNPASAFVTGHLFLLPALRLMRGYSGWDLPTTVAELRCRPGGEPGPSLRFWRARAWIEDGRVVADADREQSSSALSSFVGANALVEVPPLADPAAGDRVTVWWLNLVAP